MNNFLWALLILILKKIEKKRQVVELMVEILSDHKNLYENNI